MKRVLAIAAVLAVVMAVLVAMKIQAQNEALEGPPSGSAVVEMEGLDLAVQLMARVTMVVDEGATVAEGDVVVALDCTGPEAQRDEAKARLAAARAQADGARSAAAAAAHQSVAARASVDAARANVGALDIQEEAARREAERLASMGEHATESRRDQAQAAASGLHQQKLAARAGEMANRQSAVAAGAQAESATNQAAAADGSTAAMEAMLRRAEVAVGECRILAPRAGVVERAYFEVGELATPGAVVARIIDPTFVRATFYVPNTEIDAAHVGGIAHVVADAHGDQVFEGTVHRVGLEPEFTPRNVQTRTDRDRLVFPVEVRIPNPESLLRAGMSVTVSLRGDDP